MKSRMLKIISMLSFLLAASSLFIVAQDQPSNVDKLTQAEAKSRVQNAISKKQVTALIASAKTPDDHLKLAAYFNKEAGLMDEDARDHEHLAQVYRRTSHTTGGGKQSGAGSIFRTGEHCDSDAKSLRDAAKSLRELASEHEQMAKEAAK